MKKRQTILYCFSPPVMLATFIIEIVLMLFVLYKHRMSLVGRIISIQLFCLAMFQLAEFNVCGKAQAAVFWLSIGFVAITLLPALGIHLIQAVSRRGPSYISLIAYATSLAWIGFFLRAEAMSGHVCAGNYVIFQLNPRYDIPYLVYYFFWLLFGIAMALYIARDSNTRAKNALVWQVIGYLSFLLPVAIANAVKPSTIEGIPSIMCGFAIVYAIILVLKIIPDATCVDTKKARSD